MKQTLTEMKGLIVKITIIFRYIYTPFPIINRASRQEKMKDVGDLTNI